MASGNTLVWTRPLTIPLQPPRSRDQKQRQQQKRQHQAPRSPSKSAGYPSEGLGPASEKRSSPGTSSPRQVEKQQAQQQPYESTQNCDKEYGLQDYTKQDDMQWTSSGGLCDEDFSFTLASDPGFLKPMHLPTDLSSKSLADYLEAINPPGPVDMIPMVGGSTTGTDEGIYMTATPTNNNNNNDDDDDDDDEDDDGDYKDGGNSSSSSSSSRGNGNGDADTAANEHDDFSGYNALHLAAHTGHADVVRALLDHGAAAQQQDGRGRTALHGAVRARAHGVAHVLVCWCRELVHMRDGAGRTPLHDAVIEGDEEMVRLLLDHGADPTAVVV